MFPCHTFCKENFSPYFNSYLWIFKHCLSSFQVPFPIALILLSNFEFFHWDVSAEKQPFTAETERQRILGISAVRDVDCVFDFWTLIAQGLNSYKIISLVSVANSATKIWNVQQLLLLLCFMGRRYHFSKAATALQLILNITTQNT